MWGDEPFPAVPERNPDIPSDVFPGNGPARLLLDQLEVVVRLTMGDKVDAMVVDRQEQTR